MEVFFPLLFAGVIGFTHAFEADHLVAVSNIVTQRDRFVLAMKDGIFWGLGHTSTIFLIGIIMIIGRATFLDGYFGYFEAIVGVMLIALGVYRLYQYFFRKDAHQHLVNHDDKHHLAYGVGLVHGVAGSGAVVLLAMTELQSSFTSMVYLLIFGVGSVVGMLVAAGIFSLPFSKKWSTNHNLQLFLIVLSSALCIGYGSYVVIENLI